MMHFNPGAIASLALLALVRNMRTHPGGDGGRFLVMAAAAHERVPTNPRAYDSSNPLRKLGDDGERIDYQDYQGSSKADDEDRSPKTDDEDNEDHQAAPHQGCLNFLKTNHEVQDLAEVNFGETSSVVSNAPVQCVNGFANTGSESYPCANIDLMSLIPLSDFSDTVGESSVNGNDIWGWTHAATGREFALMGLTSGTAFVEVTDPVNPRYVGYLYSHAACSSWRDIKTYADHAFVVSEAPGHGMQVFDLTELLSVDGPNMPVQFLETAHYNGFGKAHNLVINEGSGYAYAVGTNTYSGGLHAVNIQDPASPVSAGGFGDDGYTHDAQCVMYNGPDPEYAGREICFCYNEDTITIVDVTSKSDFVEISRLGYSNSQYTHQGWLTEDGKYAIVNDELDSYFTGSNTKSHIFDVQNLAAPTYVGFHTGTTKAIAHNVYTKGGLVFEANYRAGLQVLKIDDLSTASLTEVAHFDIYPSSDSASFNGAWSNYPYFPSGTVIVSGIEQGLFILQSPNDFGSSGGVRGRRDLVPARDTAQEEPTADERRRRSLQAGCIVQDFESFSDGGNSDWSTALSTCSAGGFKVGTPEQMLNANCIMTQPGGDHTTGSGKALFTSPNASAGNGDVDGGVCVVTSPGYLAVNEMSLSVWYFHGQYDTGDDNDDYFRLEMSVDDGATYSSLVSIGDTRTRATWKEATASVPAGSTVKVRVRASDGSGSSDTIEAGVDDLQICPSATPPPTPKPTTATPTADPTLKPTTATPTADPTLKPTTATPTAHPTLKPTTATPTAHPTLKATTGSPSKNVPEVPTTESPIGSSDIVHLESPPITSAWIVQSAYFEVQGGDVWTKITDLKVTTYNTNHLQVYAKYGDASPYESTPCAWDLIAETDPDWYSGPGEMVYPTWNAKGFEPVTLPANEKVSFYVLNVGSSYGILAKMHYDSNKYFGPWIKTSSSSAVGEVSMSYGRVGYRNSPFKPYSINSRGYGIYGGIKLQKMSPESTPSSVMAHTNSFESGTFDSSLASADLAFNGLQFDVTNVGSDKLYVNTFNVRFETEGEHHIEVWMRTGTHQGSSLYCNNWNNWCKEWTMLTSSSIYSGGPEVLTQTPAIDGIVNGGSVTAFAIVSGRGKLLTGQVEAPTSSPVGDPTEPPTPLPTVQPTAPPTPLATPLPTVGLTPLPTPSPTTSPTGTLSPAPLPTLPPTTSSTLRKNSTGEVCSCSPRNLAITLSFNNTCEDVDTLSSNNGMEGVMCDSESSFDAITAVSWAEFNSMDEQINLVNYDNASFVDGDSFQIQSISSSLSTNSSVDDQLDVVVDYVQLIMYGVNATGDEIIVGDFEWQYKNICSESESESVTIEDGDELAFIVFSEVEEQLDAFCQGEAEPEESPMLARKMKSVSSPSSASASFASRFLDEAKPMNANDQLSVGLVTPIDGYYANNVQSIKAVGPPNKLFVGTIEYTISRNPCTAQSMAPWVDLDPQGLSYTNADIYGEGDISAEAPQRFTDYFA